MVIGNTLESGLRERLGVSSISGVIKEEKINAHYFQNCGQGQKGEQRVGGRRKKSRISS